MEGATTAVNVVGGVSLGLGAVVLVAYAAHYAPIVQIQVGQDTAMVINTAVSFVLAGGALLTGGWARRLLVGGLLILNAATLVENLWTTDLHLDWPGLHAWLVEPSLHPGRMAPLACAGFLMFGAAMVMLPRARNRRNALPLRWLTWLVMAVGVAGGLGYFLRIDLLFPFHDMPRMPLHSAGGLFALGLGLWFGWRGARWNRSGMSGNVHRILATATVVLVVAVVVSGFSGFVLLQHLVKRDATIALTMRRSERIGYILSLIKQARTAPEASAELALRIRDGVSVRLGLERPARLVWDDGYYLQWDQGGESVAVAIPLMQSLGFGSAIWGKSGEIGLCGAAPPGQMQCFPQRLRAQPFRLTGHMQGFERPMASALQGESGIEETLDYRGERVLAAYGPLGKTGLGLVAKMDVGELYAPLRRQLEIMVPLLAVLCIVGLELLRWQVRPLLGQLVVTRNQAQASEARFRAAAESGLDPFYIFQAMREPSRGAVVGFDLIYANQPGEMFSGLDLGANSQLGFGHVFPQSADRLRAACSRVVALREAYETELELPVRGVWVHVQAVPLGDGVAITVRDITTRKREEDRLRTLAQSDSLTGLANRAAFRERLDAAVRQEPRLAVLFLDIDRFKDINDSHGHAIGDRVLRTFGARLRGCVRARDTVARPGGDEFMILLAPLESPGDAQRVVAAIFKALEDPIHIEGRELPVATSIGLAFQTDPPLTADELVRRADTALYAAKRRGRNQSATYEAA